MAQKTITAKLDIQAQISQYQSSLDNFQKELSKLHLSSSLKDGFSNLLTDYKKELEKLSSASSSGKLSIINEKEIAKSFDKLEGLYDNLIKKMNSTGYKSSVLEKDYKAIKAMGEAEKAYKKELSGAQKELDRRQKAYDDINERMRLQKARAQEFQNVAKAAAKTEAEKAEVVAKATKELEAQKRAAEDAAKAVEKSKEGYKNRAGGDGTLRGWNLSKDAKKVLGEETEAQRQLQIATENVSKAQQDQRAATEASASASKDAANATKTLTTQEIKYKADIDNATKALNDQQEAVNKLAEDALVKLKQSLQSSKVDWKSYGIDPEAIKSYGDLEVAIEKLENAGQQNVAQEMRNMAEAVKQMEGAGKVAKQGFNEASDGLVKLTEKSKDLEQFKNRVAYFFGLTNAVNLFKRAIRSAFNTIKDLDKVMTETAVVTQFDVSDMWDQLPEYTKRANELGVSIHSAYESATIYYQQGLKTNEVIALSNQTLKMARIAGLDAADATDRMTNALRGFNMELNETNAERVADVYSKLAAISASNVDEISTAMTKVASLASNANMQFETTAAFLSQIIETTRESAETAGTALKTVVARFSEVKKLYSEGELLGTDEEGEAIDVNKVSAALRSAEINLNEYLTGMKGLDDIFLELASKWDSLDQVQQRYIATMAAGSRQQSRFIAMMQDYGRTQELVNAANNAAGASNEQYQKTLDSLESKLNRLKNAWDEFLMGITNNTLIKAAVDALTGLINVINGIISGISKLTGPLQSFTKSLLSLVTVWGGLKIGKSIFNSIFANLGSVFMGKGKEAGSAFASGFASTGTKIKQVFTKNFWVGLGGDTTQFNLVKTNLQQIETQTIALNSARQAGAAQAAVTAAAEQSLAAAELGMDEVIKKLGIDEATYQAVRNSGLTIDEQAILLNGSEASQKALNALASKELSQAEKDEAVAQALSNQESKKGLLIRAGERAQSLLNIIGIQTENSFIYKKIFAKRVENGVLEKNIALQYASLGVIGLIIAAIAILVAGIVLLAKSIETDNEKLERLTEEADKAKETADEANQALNDLLSAKDGYDDLINQLKNLEAGTDAWKQKLKEVNNEVLDLIEQYPELANYIENTSEGLKISQEGWDKMIEIQQNVADLAVAGSRAANIKKEQQQYNNVNNSIQTYQMSDDLLKAVATELQKNSALFVTSELNKDQFNNLSKAEQNRLLEANFGYIPDEEIDEIFENIGGTITNYSSDLTKIVSQYSDSISAAHDNLVAFTQGDYKESYINNANLLNESRAKAGTIAISAMSEEAINSGIFKDKNSAISFLYGDRILKDLQRDTYENMSSDELQNEYYNRTGKSGKDLEDSVIRNQLIMSDVNKEISVSIDEFYNNLKGIPAEKSKELLSVLSEEADLLNPQELVEKLMTDEGTFDTEAFQEEFGIGFDALGISINEFVQRLLTEAEYVRLTNEQANNNFELLGRDKDTYSELSGGTRKKITNQLQNVQGRTGVEGVQKVFDILDNAQNKLSPEKFQSFADAFNLLDLSDPNSVKEFSEYLRSCGITALTLGIPSFEELEASLINAAKAAEKLSTQNLDTQLSERRKYANDIKNRDSYIFTPEEMAEAIANGASQADFEWNGENYTYIGGTMETLSEALNANTDALLQATAADIQNQIPKGVSELASVISTFSSPEDWLINIQNKNKENTKEVLAEILQQYGVSQLEDENGNLTDIGNLSLDQLITTLNNLFGKYAELQTVEGYKTTGVEPNAARAINEGEAAGLNSEQLVEYANQLQIVTREQQETKELSHDMATEIAKDNLIMVNSISELSSNWQTWQEGLLADKSSTKYSESLNAIRKNMQGLLGITGKLSEEFVTSEEAMTLMERAANGDTEAIEELRTAAAQDIIAHVAIEPDEESMQQINTYLEELTSQDYVIGTVLDNSGAIDGLYDTMVEAGATTEQIQDMFNSIGWEPQFETEEYTLSDQDVRQGYVEVVDPPLLPGEQAKTRRIPVQSGMAAGATIQIPKLRGKNNHINATYRGKVSTTTSPTIPTSNGSSGGGGGKEEKPSYWENPYDELYNLTEKINEAMRTREALEREYDKLLDKRTTSTQQILKNSLDEIALLRQQLDYEKQMEAGRRRQVENIGSQMYTDDEGNRTAFSELGVMKYASYDFETGLIQIDWSGLEEIANDASREEEGKQAEAYISKLEELVGQYEDVRDAVWEIEDKLEEIRERSIDESIEFQQRLYDAIVSQKQAIIDSFDAMSQTIEETTSKVIDNVREQIQAERQQRQNEETESDIADKEARLAYLSRDTSGANQLETMKLQKEIDDARQNYSDSLIDQAIDQMQKDADLAAEQRAQQIQIMQAQLDIATENGEFWSDVKALLDDAFNPDGTLKEGSKLVQLLKDTEAFKGMSEMGQDQWINDMVEAWLTANEGLSNWKMKKAEEAGSLTLGNGTKLTYKDGKWTDGKNTYSDVGYDVQSGQFVGTNNKDYKPAQPSGGGKAGTGSAQPAKQEPTQAEVTDAIKRGVSAAVWNGNQGWDPDRSKKLKEVFGSGSVYSDIIDYINAGVYSGDPSVFSYANMKKKNFKKYESGGLASYTGLAWLDGSRAKPEAILSAQDTKNFIALRDILAQFMGSGAVSGGGKSGDNYFDIDIQAEIGSDYDVDRLASQIKQQIYNDSTYRNVNAINYIR